MIKIDEISKEFNINIINIYRYGSYIYGTKHENSDEDYIVICNQLNPKIDSVSNENRTVNLTLYSIDGFKKDLNNHEISTLECLWLRDEDKIEKIKFNFKLDIFKLRKSISSTSSNSFVKAKKKIEQGDIYIGQKSLFHSLRIFDYGIQIAKNNKIIDYRKDFKILLKNISSLNDWESLKEIYKPKYNELHSKFKKYTLK